MKKKNIVLAILLALICLALGIGIGYVLSDKVDDSKDQSNNNINSDNNQQNNLEDLYGNWIDCNEKRGAANCNFIVSIDDEYFLLGQYGTDGIYSGNITKIEKNENKVYLTVHSPACIDEMNCMEIVQEKYFNVEIDISNLKINKIEVKLDEDNSEAYYFAGKTHDDINKYIEEKNIEIISEKFKLAYNFFEEPNTYCGPDTNVVNNAPEITDEMPWHASSAFTSYQELLNYLKKYMSESLISRKISVDPKNYEDNYLEENNYLYCMDLGKGGIYNYGDVFVQLISENDNTIEARVIQELLGGYEYPVYDIVELKLENNKGNWIITTYEKVATEVANPNNVN